MKKLIYIIIIAITVTLSVGAGALAEEDGPVTLSVRGEEGRFEAQGYLCESFCRLARGRLGRTFLMITDSGYSVEEAVSYVFPGLGESFSAFLSREERVEQEARLTFTPDKKEVFAYEPEVVGRTVNREALARDVARLLNGEIDEITLEILKIQPRTTANDLRKRTICLATFSTNYARSARERKRNVALATGAVHGTVIEPGETFSFNERVGARTEERGYESANVIVGGRYVKGVGGGVCQVSTTLYNAALRAGLEIKEARGHSLAPSYVPLSQDAMVSTTSDLKFKNASQYPVYVTGRADGERIIFSVYGAWDGITRSYESVTLEVIGSGEGETVDDPELPLGTVVVERGIEGYRSECYEIVRLDDGRTERRLIRRDRYSAKRELIRRGTGPVEGEKTDG